MAPQKKRYFKRKTPNPKPKAGGTADRRLSHIRRGTTEERHDCRNPEKPPELSARESGIISNETCEASPVIKYIHWYANAEEEDVAEECSPPLNTIFRPVSHLRTYKRTQKSFAKSAPVSIPVSTPPRSEQITEASKTETPPLPTPTPIKKIRESQKKVENYKVPEEYCRPAGFDPNIHKLTQRRIVDIAHFVTECRKLEGHVCETEPYNGYLSYMEERVNGIHCTLVFQCDTCRKEVEIKLTEAEPDEINMEAVSAIYTIGRGHYHLEEFLTFIRLPCPSYDVFRRIEARMGKEWIACSTDAITENGKEARDQALAKNQVDSDGVPIIPVLADCSWCHRTYGHNYNAKSGAAIIIAKDTKKLLYLGVRNKYCYNCAVAQKKRVPVREHPCFKNWTGTSTGMESDMITEAFKDSEKVHGVRYNILIADGDSSAYKSIQETVSYGRDVEKLRCVNHLMKNVSKQLHELRKSLTKKETPQEKDWFTSERIRGILRNTRRVVEKLGEKKESRETIVQTIKNLAPHFLGDHKACSRDYCLKGGTVENLNLASSFMTELAAKLEHLTNFTTSIIECETTNLAESFMHLITKFTGAKQVFYGRRASYLWRVHGASLLFQYGQQWRSKVLKFITKKSPASIVKRIDQKRARKVIGTARRKLEMKKGPLDVDDDDENLARPLASTSTTSKPSQDYGKHSQQPDLAEEVLKLNMERRLKQVCIDEEKIQETERRTIGQADNLLWRGERKFRLTASKFGAVCKRRKPPGELVYSILWAGELKGPAIEWGKTNERTAVRKFEQRMNLKTRECGLFVDRERGYLAASPDALVEEDAVLEVKCPFSARTMTIAEIVEKKGSAFYLRKDKKTDEIKLHKSHNYYYQLQGEMAISNRSKGYFVVWTPKDIHIEVIAFDQKMWQTMVPLLEKFYFNEMLVELVDSRHLRRMPIRNSAAEATMRTKQQERLADENGLLHNDTQNGQIETTTTAHATKSPKKVIRKRQLKISDENKTQKTRKIETRHVQQKLPAEENAFLNDDIQEEQIETGTTEWINAERVTHVAESPHQASRIRGQEITAKRDSSIRRMTGKVPIRLRNGLCCGRVLVKDTYIKVNLTCAFDSLASIIAASLEEYEVYRTLAESQRSNPFVNFTFMMTENCTSEILYTERANIILSNNLSEITGSGQNVTADCLNNISRICWPLKSVPTAIETTICLPPPFPPCGYANERNLPFKEPCMDEIIGGEHWCSHMDEIVLGMSKAKQNKKCKQCQSNSALVFTKYGIHILILTDLIEDSFKFGNAQFQSWFNIHQLAVHLTLESKRYILAGIVHYSSNHYIAYVRRVDGTWERHDDLRTEVQLNPSLNDLTPHLIVYVQQSLAELS